MAYNVYLFSGLGITSPMNRPTMSAQQILDITRTLQGYFDKVVRAHDALRLPGAQVFGSASVQWLASYPTVLPHELLIYLLPTGATVVSKGKVEAGKPPAGHDGLTNPNLTGGTGSEVYFHFNDATLIANLMFHEAMHNKLALGNAGLHPRGGLADGPQGGTGPITPTTPLTNRNIDDMARALGTSRPQWTAGIQLLVNEAMRPDSDPSKGLF